MPTPGYVLSDLVARFMYRCSAEIGWDSRKKYRAATAAQGTAF